MQIINDRLMELVIGQAAVFKNLAVYPLLSPGENPVDYLTLDEAFEQDGADITEVSESGHVPELLFENKLDSDVLLLDGDELVGAKQNRILNLSILVGAGHKVTIPVSCVEQGRWSYRSRKFSSSRRNLYGSLKACKAYSVTRSMRSHNAKSSNQGEIWDGIAEKCLNMGFIPDTGAVGDLYEAYDDQLMRYQKAFQAVEGQVGAIFVVGGKIAGLDLFESHMTLSKTLGKLIGSFAMDAMEVSSKKSKLPDESTIREFLDRIRNAHITEHKAVDLGLDVRFSDQQLAGGALVVDERLVHLSAYNLQERVRAPLF